jgi:hypothetical protein
MHPQCGARLKYTTVLSDYYAGGIGNRGENLRKKRQKVGEFTGLVTR